ncbi:MAG: hypothetical protein IJ685_07325 [Selenomonadaceae bacterium]|nr:hypothetical protein [Selenomonadaceae bacterium]
MRCKKIFLCIMLILFAATLSGCNGTAIKNTVKSAGKSVGKTVKKVPGAVKEEVRDQAVEMAYDAVTGNNQPTHNNQPNNNRPSNTSPPARTPAKPSRLAGAGAVAVGGAVAANEFLSEDRHWIKDNNSGAYVWNPEPQDGESVHWDGEVVRSEGNLYAHGTGTLTWYKDGQVIQVDEGTFERGRHQGKFKHTFKSGRVDYSDWNNGVEISAPNSSTNSAEDSAWKTFSDYHQAITDKKYSQAYDVLTSEQKGKVGGFDSYSAGYSNTLSSEVSKLSTVNASDNSVTFNYKLTARDRIQGNKVKIQIFKGQVTLINFEGRWFIDYAKSSKVDEYLER